MVVSLSEQLVDVDSNMDMSDADMFNYTDMGSTLLTDQAIARIIRHADSQNVD